MDAKLPIDEPLNEGIKVEKGSLGQPSEQEQVGVSGQGAPSIEDVEGPKEEVRSCCRAQI